MAKSNIPVFNLLSIGHRGVGKSVFLAGIYAELQMVRQTKTKGIWVEGANYQTQNTLETMLIYMGKTGNYVSPTIKITDFILRVRSRGLNQYKSDLCEVHWADIPGEICRLDNPDFERMMLDSHGCCVFIDAAALVQDPQYLTRLEDTIKQIEVISTLATQRQVSYFFALILTKCDQLKAGPKKLVEIEEKWKSLTARLVTANAVYRRFNSAVSLIPTGKTAVVKAEGASAPILWLVSELGKVYKTQAPVNLRGEVGATTESTGSSMRPKSILPTVLAMVGAVCVVALIWLGLGQFAFNSEPVTVPSVEGETSESTDGS